MSAGSAAMVAVGSASRHSVRLTTRGRCGGGSAALGGLAGVAVVLGNAADFDGDFDGDDVGVGRPNGGGAQRGQDVVTVPDSVQVAVQQQDLDQGAGATGITVRGAGRGPERLVLDREPPRDARACLSAVAPGRAPGLRARTSR